MIYYLFLFFRTGGLQKLTYIVHYSFLQIVHKKQGGEIVISFVKYGMENKVK
jgi:hypothetical protein